MRKLTHYLNFLILIILSIQYSDGAIKCQCAQQGTVTYSAECSGSSLIAVRRAIIGRTLNTQDSQYCSRISGIVAGDCAVVDTGSSWGVRGSCNNKKTSCSASLTYHEQLISSCANQGYIYACTEYECLQEQNSDGQTAPVVYLSAGTNQQYNVAGKFQMMTSLYSSATSQIMNQCRINMKAGTAMIIKLQDVRSRRLPSTNENDCAYRLTITTHLETKEWCPGVAWIYEEHQVRAPNYDVHVDIKFNRVAEGEGALWATVEANSPENVIVCGDNIEVAPTSTTTTSTTTTTTTRPTTTTTTTTRPTTTTTTGAPTTTTTTRPTTTTTRLTTTTPTTTRTMVATTTTTKTSFGQPATTTSRASTGMPATTTTRSQAATTTSRVVQPTTTPQGPPGGITGRSQTPGVFVNTPGVAIPRVVVGESKQPSDGLAPSSIVAIVVTVVLVGLILLVVLGGIIYCVVAKRKQNGGLPSQMHHPEPETPYEPAFE